MPMEQPTINDYRIDMNHYWTRLMWYRDELWRVTNPIFTAYGAFIIAMFGYLFTKDKTISVPMLLNMMLLLAGVTSILIRLYIIYSSRIYEAIKYLNHEIEIREQRIYRKFAFFSDFDDDKEHFGSNYRKFKVFPELHILFGIIVMMMSSVLFLMLISMLASLDHWCFDVSNLFIVLFITAALGGFELHIKSYTIQCNYEMECDKNKINQSKGA